MANELLEFEDGTLGIALNLDTREIGVVVLGDFDKIEEGQTVRRTGEILSVRAGCRFAEPGLLRATHRFWRRIANWLSFMISFIST